MTEEDTDEHGGGLPIILSRPPLWSGNRLRDHLLWEFARRCANGHGAHAVRAAKSAHRAHIKPSSLSVGDPSSSQITPWACSARAGQGARGPSWTRILQEVSASTAPDGGDLGLW